MKQLFLIIGLISVFNIPLFSQDNIETKSIKINFNPLATIDLYPRIRVGAEYISDKKLGYSLDFGIGNNFLNKWRLNGMIWEKDYSFYEIRPEIKYFIRKEDDFSLYGATELFFILMRSQLQAGHYQRGFYSNEINFDSALFNRQKKGIQLKGGVDVNIRKRFDIDIYGGIGIAERTIKYSDIINPVEGEGPIFVEWLPQNHLFEGKSVILHLSIGFKVGYTLWKK
jgi:hypothetical protein